MPRPPIPCEPDLLARVTIRLLEDHERDRFDLLLEERHSLHSSVIVGQHLRHVAELDGRWVALLAFSAASLHLKGRDKRIGGSPRQRARRLSFVADNRRFLVLSDRQSLPDLASRVLGSGNGTGAFTSSTSPLLSAATHHLRLSPGQVSIGAKSSRWARADQRSGKRPGCT